MHSFKIDLKHEWNEGVKKKKEEERTATHTCTHITIMHANTSLFLRTL